MIPFDELVRALDRYKRRQAGESVPDISEATTAPPRQKGGARAVDLTTDIPIDDIEEA